MSEETKKLKNTFAFPNPELSIAEGFDRTDMYGMTLRDYFAAKAMQSLLNTMYTRNEVYEPAVMLRKMETISKNSYWFAEEMLKQREL